MQCFYVYILKCADGSYYVGHTDNLEKRMSEHNYGQSSEYTATRLPLKLVFSQTCADRHEALQAERQIKQWSRKKKEALIQENWDLLKLLSKKNF